MNLTSVRTVIGIGAVALTLAGGVAPGLVDAKDRQGGKGQARAEREAGAEQGIIIPPQLAKCNGVLATMFLSQFPAGQPVEGTDGRDVVIGTNGRDIFIGNGGNDLVCLKGGNDDFRPGVASLNGTDGNDSVRGGPGADVIDGGLGNDNLHGEDGPDVLKGGVGDDSCLGGPGTDLNQGGCEFVNSVEIS